VFVRPLTLFDFGKTCRYLWPKKLYTVLRGICQNSSIPRLESQANNSRTSASHHKKLKYYRSVPRTPSPCITFRTSYGHCVHISCTTFFILLISCIANWITLLGSTNALFYMLCILILIWPYMLRRNRHLQRACTNVVKAYRSKTVF